MLHHVPSAGSKDAHEPGDVRTAKDRCQPTRWLGDIISRLLEHGSAPGCRYFTIRAGGGMRCSWYRLLSSLNYEPVHQTGMHMTARASCIELRAVQHLEKGISGSRHAI